MSERSQNNTTNLEPQVLEQGDIYFFYRPKKDAQEVKGVEDVRRFFMVTAPEEKRGEEVDNNKSPRYTGYLSQVKSHFQRLGKLKLGALKDIGLEQVVYLKTQMSLQKSYSQMNLEKATEQDQLEKVNMQQ